jgi:IS5 family transposase
VHGLLHDHPLEHHLRERRGVRGDQVYRRHGDVRRLHVGGGRWGLHGHGHSEDDRLHGLLDLQFNPTELRYQRKLLLPRVQRC